MDAKPILREGQAQLSKTESLEEIRLAIQQLAGNGGEKIWKVLIDIAEGRTWFPELPGGRPSVPITPTTTERLRAAEILIERLFGKPVSMVEMMQARAATKDLETLRQLSDEELERRVSEIISKRDDLK